jgi:hypothetical protein
MKYVMQKLLVLLFALGISFLLFWYGVLHPSWVDKLFFSSRTTTFWVSLLIVILITMVVSQIVLSKWRPVKIFFSYHLKDISLVRDLNNALHRHGIQSHLCYFDSPDHDDVIAAVQSGIRACDTLVVLPGTEPSFIDAEILAAAVAQKGVVIINRETETLPNTAYEGYPVFVLAKLQKKDFKPLVNFLNFVHGRLAPIAIIERLGIISLALSSVFWIPLIIIACVETVSDTLAVFVGIKAAIKVSLYLSVILTTLIVGIVLGGIAWANFNRLRTARVLRQRIITRTATYEILENCLPITDEINSCLNVSPLKKRHT